MAGADGVDEELQDVVDDGADLDASTLLPALPDAELDRIARLATLVLGTPVALVSMVSRGGQVLPGSVGLPEPWQSRRATPLTHSLCQLVVRAGSTLAVDDVRADPRAAASLAVPELGVVAYAGAPLRLSAPEAPEVGGGAVVGVLCAIDHEPRAWTGGQIAVLEDLAATCSAELSLRLVGERNRLLLHLSESLADARTVTGVARTVSAVARDLIGGARGSLLVHDAAHRCLRRVEDGTGRAGALGADVVALALDHPVAVCARERRARLFPDRAALVDRFAWFADGRADTTTAPCVSAYLPLLAGPELIGVLVLGWAEERTIAAGETATWDALARYTAQAVHRAQLEESHRSNAETLQRSLLPTLPTPPGLDLRGRYYPAATEDEVGGDWFDAVVLPDGSTTLVIGDVTGHDMAAAATMGQMRGLLRAFAWDRAEPPAQLVTRFEGTLAGLAVEGLATLVLAHLEPRAAGTGTVRLRWTNAGHPPPVVLLPDGTTELLASPPELLVGLVPGTVRSDHVVDLPVGATVLFYTDGLIEHRGRSLIAGLQRVRDVLAPRGRSTLDDLLDAVVAELLAAEPEDDCALLVVRVT